MIEKKIVLQKNFFRLDMPKKKVCESILRAITNQWIDFPPRLA